MSRATSKRSRSPAPARFPFVGRQRELSLWSGLLDREPRGALYVHGPGGIGKTALVDELARMARERSYTVVHLEVSALETTPKAIVEHLAEALDMAPRAVLEGMPWPRKKHALLVDGCERMGAAAGWLTRALLPMLPEGTPVALAGRARPEEPWIAAAIAARQLVPLALEPWDESESNEYLGYCDVPPDQRDALARLSRGNPLALSLSVEVAKSGGAPAALESAPELIQTLLARLLDATPRPSQRAALEVLAVARSLPESLLEHWIGPEEAHETFRWLSRLPFVRLHPSGLVPHDLARDVLLADLKWRNPERLGALRLSALGFFLARAQYGSPAKRQHAIVDAGFLYNDLPMLAAYVRFSAYEKHFPEPALADDAGDVEDMLAEHEGERAGRIARRWLERHPEGSFVVRDHAGTPCGYFACLRLDRVTDEEASEDPITVAALQHLARAGFERHAPVLFNRHWLSATSYQSVSPVQAVCTALMAQAHLEAPDLHGALGVFRDTAIYRLMFATTGFAPVADVELDDRRYAIVLRDWRREGPLLWFKRFVEQVSGLAKVPDAGPLTRDRFDAAVRDALKNAAFPHRLADNPLASTPLVGAASTPSARGAAVRTMLTEANDALRAAPRAAKQARAVAATYFEAIGSQEQVAEELDLPFSTYRRHLTSGVERISEALYARYRELLSVPEQ